MLKTSHANGIRVVAMSAARLQNKRASTDDERRKKASAAASAARDNRTAAKAWRAKDRDSRSIKATAMPLAAAALLKASMICQSMVKASRNSGKEPNYLISAKVRLASASKDAPG